MSFPVWIGIGALRIHPHVLFEILAYAVAVALFLRLRGARGDEISARDRWTVMAAAAVGGALGARFLSLVQLSAGGAPAELAVGKTIVGGLVGGLIVVELVKKRAGITTATGDLLAIPLAVGIAVGRIGCFLTGLDDHTYGNPTSLAIGVDFGDGIPRHPTQLYEIGFLAVLASLLVAVRGKLPRPGDEFRLFMVSYLSFRLAVEFIKPDPALAAGLSAIQWACLSTLTYYAVRWRSR